MEQRLNMKRGEGSEILSDTGKGCIWWTVNFSTIHTKSYLWKKGLKTVLPDILSKKRLTSESIKLDSASRI